MAKSYHDLLAAKLGVLVYDYQRVIEGIASQIERGELREGDKLPSIVRLAEEYDVSQTTVKTALLILRQSGLVIGRQGKGTFVAPRSQRSQTVQE